ncbi:MAG: hypothetical protein ACR2NM_16795 [Bythopirellula sp.]
MHSRGFTLLEVVLAIGLSGAVLGLLATAIDLYLVRVDASRTEVEIAQLARTLLNQIADDVQAARYDAPRSPSDDSSAESGPVDPALVQGIFGTAAELRIDRSAIWRWDSAAQELDMQHPNAAASTTPIDTNMPQTVRYLLGEGRELLTAKLAEQGVSVDPQALGYAGLYREQLSTAAWMSQDSSASSLVGNNIENATLIAPEVVDMTFAYFDGTQMLDEWDSSLSEQLPKAIEIRLTLLEQPWEQAVQHTPDQRDEQRRHRENLVEYRRFVRVPNLSKPLDASFPQPQQQQQQQPGQSPF